MGKEYLIAAYVAGVILSWAWVIAFAYSIERELALGGFIFGWLPSLGWPLFALAAIIYSVAF